MRQDSSPFENANLEDSAMNPLNEHQHHPSGLSSNERFELLSAYLDGEVTAAERQQVEQLLDSDVQMRQMYQRLSGLHQGMSQMSAPTETDVEALIDNVFEKVDRRSRFRLIVGGSLAAAAAAVAAVTGVMSLNSPAPQFATNSVTPTVESIAPASEEIGSTEGLLVVMDDPALIVSKSATVEGSKTPSNVAGDQ
jgi:anti-sigma factor RsiW